MYKKFEIGFRTKFSTSAQMILAYRTLAHTDNSTHGAIILDVEHNEQKIRKSAIKINYKALDHLSICNPLIVLKYFEL